jgi:hypothetical protein
MWRAAHTHTPTWPLMATAGARHMRLSRSTAKAVKNDAGIGGSATAPRASHAACAAAAAGAAAAAAGAVDDDDAVEGRTSGGVGARRHRHKTGAVAHAIQQSHDGVSHHGAEGCGGPRGVKTAQRGGRDGGTNEIWLRSAFCHRAAAACHPSKPSASLRVTGGGEASAQARAEERAGGLRRHRHCGDW